MSLKINIKKTKKLTSSNIKGMALSKVVPGFYEKSYFLCLSSSKI
jgi:hypothetical protein